MYASWPSNPLQRLFRTPSALDLLEDVHKQARRYTGTNEQLYSVTRLHCLVIELPLLNMALTESRLPFGRISRTQLHHHVTSRSCMTETDLCTLSSNDVEVYMASLLINAKHINSCLQRTMIKHWMSGDLGGVKVNHQEEATSNDANPTQLRLQLLQRELQRLTFVKEYRAAYATICIATDSLSERLQLQTSKWDSQNVKQRQKVLTSFQTSLRTYYEAVADLVLSLLPGQLFLDVYSRGHSL